MSVLTTLHDVGTIRADGTDQAHTSCSPVFLLSVPDAHSCI